MTVERVPGMPAGGESPAGGGGSAGSPAARHAEATRILTGDEAGELLAAACEAAGTVLGRWALRSVHHRAGRSVSAVYDARLRLDDEDRPVLLVAHADVRPLPEGTFALSRGRHTIAVWRVPHDPFLHGLPSALDADRVRELLDALDGPPGDVVLRTRAYRPSRRAVVEVTVHRDDVSARVLYLKVLSDDRAVELATVHRELSAVLPVPRLIGVAERQGIVALEALGGSTLRTAIVEGADAPEAGELVELSAALARCELTSSRDPSRFADPGRHVELLSGLLPGREADLVAAARAAAGVGGPVATVHGDLHDAQILVQTGQVTGLIDLDGAGRGRVAQDLGSLVAHLEAVGEVWPGARTRAARLTAEVVDEAVRLVPFRDLARAAAGAWLGLATGPYRAQDPDWPEATGRRIDRAVEWARLSGVD